MSGFSSGWLRLREPADLAARNSDVEAAFLASLPNGERRILDLASGAGSTLAALLELAGPQTNWLLTDHDPALLKVSAERFSDLGSNRMEIRQIDLQEGLEDLPIDQVDGVTTSAFLDLVSEAFLERLASTLAKTGTPFLASLSYDGRAEFTPSQPFDVELLEALNQHQRQDKGIGTALGPDAAARTREIFEAQGYRVTSGRSDWVLDVEHASLAKELLHGWARAGREIGLPADAISYWLEQRCSDIGKGALTVRIGHTDLAAIKD